MKFKILVLALSISSFSLNAQININYESHSLQNTGSYTIQETEYVSPGNSGKDVLWDFSELKCDKTKQYYITEPEDTENGKLFRDANVSVSEGSNTFYFDIDDVSNKFLGLCTDKAFIKYNEPIEKIKYPFRFHDKSTTSYSGEGIYYGSVHTDIYGNYSVEADATGIIIMPDKISIPDVIRIKTTDVINEFSCNNTKFINTKYLWYAKDIRYPIFVISENISINNEGDTTITKSSYYNETKLAQKSVETSEIITKISGKNKLTGVYPNPFSEHLNIKYDLINTAEVSLEIINANGSLVEELINNKKQKGNQNYEYDANKLAKGTYFVKLTIDERIFLEKVIKSE